MKILIIGKTGQIGRCLVNAAKSHALNYTATDRKTLDITNQEALTNFFTSHHDFDFIINAAAYTNVDGAEKDKDAAYSVNCTAVGYLAQQAKQYEVPILHISTDYVFNGNKITGYAEEDKTDPINTYGETKKRGEEELIKIWHKHIILRVSWVFSSYGKNFVKSIATLCNKTNQLRVVCDQFGSPTSAESVAEVILLICKKIDERAVPNDCWGIYHYTDFPVTNWHQLATHIIRSRSSEEKFMKPFITAIESSDCSIQADRPKYGILNIEKIRTMFQIQQASWMPAVEAVLQKLEE